MAFGNHLFVGFLQRSGSPVSHLGIGRVDRDQAG
jgi:hypothetical protein